MNESTIANRYAGGLLEASIEQDILEDVRRTLDAFSRAVAEHTECRAILADPSISTQIKEQILSGLLQQLGAPKLLERFTTLLCEKRRTGLLQEIGRAFNRLADENAGVTEVAVTSARGLAQNEIESLRAALSRMLSRDVRLRTETDPALLGGVVVRMNTTVMDGSIRTKLRKIAEQIS